MHKDVDSTLSTTRKQAVKHHNAKPHVVPYKPTAGDYVVVARTQGLVPRRLPTGSVPAVFRASSPTSASSSRISSLVPLFSFTSAASSRTPTLWLEPRRRQRKSLSSQMASGTLSTRSKTPEKPLMASKFSLAGKDSLLLVIPGSCSPSCSKTFPPSSRFLQAAPPQPDSSP